MDIVKINDREFEINPLMIYQAFKLSPGKSKHTFTLGVDNTDFNGSEILSNFGESDITKRLLAKAGCCSELFNTTGIKYPNCWIGVEVKKEELFENWPHSLPGDVDLIAGNYFDNSNTIDFSSINSYQIKIRKIREYDELKSFSTGTGTEQTEFTAKMGFNKNYLLHVIIREPRSTESHQSISFGTAHNGDFFRAFNASHGIVKAKLENSPIGYGLLGWGQAQGIDWRVSGAFSVDLIKEAPYLNNFEPKHKRELDDSIMRIFENRRPQRPLLYLNKKHLSQSDLMSQLGVFV